MGGEGDRNQLSIGRKRDSTDFGVGGLHADFLL